MIDILFIAFSLLMLYLTHKTLVKVHNSIVMWNDSLPDNRFEIETSTSNSLIGFENKFETESIKEVKNEYDWMEDCIGKSVYEVEYNRRREKIRIDKENEKARWESMINEIKEKEIISEPIKINKYKAYL